MSIIRVTSIVAISLVLILLSNLVVFSSVHLGYFTHQSLWFDIVSAFVAFIMLGVVPVLVTTFFLKLPLSEIGVCLPENKKQSILYSFFIIAIFLFPIIFFSKQSVFISYYAIKLSLLPFIISATASIVYYLAEEFFFHGFLLFYTKKYIGLHSVWVTSILFAILHVGKPIDEVFFAFFLGIALSLLSIKTKSFLPSALVHFILAAALIIFIQV